MYVTSLVKYGRKYLKIEKHTFNLNNFKSNNLITILHSMCYKSYSSDMFKINNETCNYSLINYKILIINIYIY